MRDVQYQDALYGVQEDAVRELLLQPAYSSQTDEDTAFPFIARVNTDVHLGSHTGYDTTCATDRSAPGQSHILLASALLFQAQHEPLLVGAWFASVT